MTIDEARRLLSEYRAGIEAELRLLRQLEAVSERQNAATRDGNLSTFNDLSDERDRLMHSLLTVETSLRGVRQMLADHRSLASQVEDFEAVAALHRDASHLVGTILASDRASLSALADAEIARRSAAAGLERGETTLAAYRKVLAPTASGATLVNRRG